MNKYILLSVFSFFAVSNYIVGQKGKKMEQASQVQSTSYQPAIFSSSASLILHKNRFSPESNYFLKDALIERDNRQFISAFVLVSDAFDEAEFDRINAVINTRVSNILTVNIPIDELEHLSSIDGIFYVETGHKVEPRLDKALSFTSVNTVHEGLDLPHYFSGDSVIIGVIDHGFDYTHPTFYDSAYNNYRISKVWEQNNETGTSPPGFSYGTEMDTQSEILNWQYSDDESSHGTHVAGIAAGSGSALSDTYRGVAYKSEIVFVSFKSNLQHTNIADGISYIFNHSDAVDKPAVVNLSLGSHLGPHDGSSVFDQFCDNISTNGKIIVGAAGNEGNDKLHLKHSFEARDTVYSFIEFTESTPETSGITFLDIWGEEGQDFSVSVNIYNTERDEYEDYTGHISTAENATNSYLLEDEDDIDIDEIQVEISSEHSNHQNNKPHIRIYLDNSEQDETGDEFDYAEIEIAAENSTIDAWCAGEDKAVFTSLNYSFPQIDGDGENTVGEIGGTGKSIISVGAYTSKNQYEDYQGENYDLSSYAELETIAPFSSKGPTIDSRIKPDIAAPGIVIVSSVNSFDGSYDSTSPQVVANVSDEINEWWFAVSQGTSMSSPVVSGIIALWLEATPNISAEKVKYFMQKYASTDSHTGSVPNNRWGSGKIDAYETLKALLNAFTVTSIASPEDGGKTDGGDVFEADQVCNLMATPEDGHLFVNWTEEGTVVSTEPNYSFVVNSSRNLTANFQLEGNSINESGTSPFRIYPNPSSGALHIEGDDNNIMQKVIVTDIAGKKVIDRVSSSNREIIDVSGLETGIYMLTIRTNETDFVEKIIIK